MSKINCLVLPGCELRFIKVSLLLHEIDNRLDREHMTIYCTSGSIMSALSYACNQPVDKFLSLLIDNSHILRKITDMSMYSLIINILNESIAFHINTLSVISIILVSVGFDKHISMIDFYNKTKVCLKYNIFNTTTEETEIWDHTTHPDLAVIEVCQYACAVPIIFGKRSLNNNSYIDGGLVIQHTAHLAIRDGFNPLVILVLFPTTIHNDIKSNAKMLSLYFKAKQTNMTYDCTRYETIRLYCKANLKSLNVEYIASQADEFYKEYTGIQQFIPVIRSKPINSNCIVMSGTMNRFVSMAIVFYEEVSKMTLDALYVTSGSSFVAIAYSLGYSIHDFISFITVNISSFQNINDISLYKLYNLVNHQKLIGHNDISDMLSLLLEDPDMTLEQLYQKNKILVNFNVFNTHTESSETWNHINNPNTLVIYTCLSTIGIPLYTGPNDIYVDGGYSSLVSTMNAINDGYSPVNIVMKSSKKNSSSQKDIAFNLLKYKNEYTDHLIDTGVKIIIIREDLVKRFDMLYLDMIINKTYKEYFNNELEIINEFI